MHWDSEKIDDHPVEAFSDSESEDDEGDDDGNEMNDSEEAENEFDGGEEENIDNDENDDIVHRMLMEDMEDELSDED